jgi:spermidine/putrescine transport system permease protein
MTLRRQWLPIYYVLILGLLYLPIIVLFLFSVSSNTTVAFPLKGLTLDWYVEALQGDALIGAVRNSVLVGILSSTLATALGTVTALLLARFEFRGKRVLAALAVLPLIVPYVVLGVALLILFRSLDVEMSALTIAIAHVVVALPFVVLIVMSRLIGFDRALEDAAMDLGATYPQTLRLVVVPIILPAVVSAWLVAFTVSFDEIALALFLAGRDQTFPVYLAGQIRFASNLPPLIAAAMMLMAGSLLLVLVSERIRRAR